METIQLVLRKEPIPLLPSNITIQKLKNGSVQCVAEMVELEVDATNARAVAGYPLQRIKLTTEQMICREIRIQAEYQMRIIRDQIRAHIIVSEMEELVQIQSMMTTQMREVLNKAQVGKL
jgi:hypothetical protein